MVLNSASLLNIHFTRIFSNVSKSVVEQGIKDQMKIV